MSRGVGGGTGTGGNGIWPDTANYIAPGSIPNRILPPTAGISDDVSQLIYSGFTASNTTNTGQFGTVPWVSNIENSSNSSAKMWKSDKNSENQRAMFLGTEQWGMESGGAPWGQTPASDPSPSDHLTETNHAVSLTSNQFGKPIVTDVGRTMAEYVLGAVNTKNNMPTFVSSDVPKNVVANPVEVGNPIKTNKSGSQKNSGSNSSYSPTEASASNSISPTNSQNSGKMSNSPTPDQKSSAVTSPTVDKTEATVSQDENQENIKTIEASGEGSPNNEAKPTEANVQNFPASDGLEFGETQNPPITSIDSTIQQMQNLNLDYTAMQQQSLAAAHLAVQQQYMLAAQQQQLACFLPSINPYIIAGTPGNAAAGYGDPHAAAAAYSMMTQYPYAPWPSAAYTSSMLQPMASTASTQNPTSTATVSPATPTSQSQAQGSRPGQPPRSPFQSEGGATPSDTPQLQGQGVDVLTANTALQAAQFGINPMAMGPGYQMIPAGYYDQTGAFIVNNGRLGPLGGQVRLFPAPFVMNSSGGVPTSGAVYTSPNLSGGSSTPVGPMYSANIPPASFGFNNGTPGLATSIGSHGSGIGSSSSTPQRRDSFSDPYAKHQPPYPSHISNFYNSLGGSVGIGAISPSPGPLGGFVGSQSHHSLSPPPLLSSPTSSVISASQRQFPVAPGAEARYKNGNMLNAGLFGNSGSALFPPTRIRPLSASGRSRLLDDFRNNRCPNPQLRDLVNHIVEFSRDQHGSRFIQQKLERAAPQEKQLVFNEISGAAYQLMTDVFGNYVIQKFFEFGSQEQKLALAQCICGHVLPLALQMYGCRVIQKALECIPHEEQVNIVKELDGHLLKCVKDQNGNHVVQKCIECVPPVHLQFIVDSFKGQVMTLSTHPYGCRVMQRILEHCTDDQTNPILEELNQHIEALVMDQYGNYVIQHILEHGRQENKRNIVLELSGKVLTLSQHKFASNVVEKCVSNSSHQERVLLIEEVCQDTDSLYFMMKDQFANYVVQKMLDVAEPAQRNMLIQRIRPHMQHLRKFTYGKHIINKLEKYIVKSSSVPTSPSLVNPASPINVLPPPPQAESTTPSTTSSVLVPP